MMLKVGRVADFYAASDVFTPSDVAISLCSLSVDWLALVEARMFEGVLLKRLKETTRAGVFALRCLEVDDPRRVER